MIIQMQANWKQYKEGRFYDVSYKEALVLVNKSIARIVPDKQLNRLTAVKYELRG